jgi:hypothetical protein
MGAAQDEEFPAANPPLKLQTFHAELFRRGGRDETILLRMKPFSTFRADIPKR